MKTYTTYLILGLFALVLSLPCAMGQGTAFTYQGQLKDAGTPANGTNYGMTFNLFDASTSGNQLGSVGIASVPVSNGLFTVTLDFGANFPGADRWLEINVQKNGGGFTTLSPRQKLTPSPYAITSGNVTGPIDGGAITAGTVGASQLAPGVAAANLSDSGQAGVASGGIILSTSANATSLINAGYVKLGQAELGDDSWHARAGNGPSVRTDHTAVWTGTEMIIWGGFNGTAYLNSGWRFNPASNSWTVISSVGAPSVRRYHTAVWTGSEMIIWGGFNGGYLNSGARYDPVSDSWTSVTTSGAPSAREEHTAVWSGGEMIVWGGYDGLSEVGTGARYNPASDTWVATPGGPSARFLHTAVWTGTEMIIWGGDTSDSGFSGDFGRYNPSSNTWISGNTTGEPSGRFYHSAVWTGTDMIVWGGANPTVVGDGARYNVTSNAWTTMSAVGAPSARQYHTAVWTGTEMIVWGGNTGGAVSASGAIYNPAANSWTAMTAVGVPVARQLHTAVWTGSEMTVFGGVGSAYLNDTWSFTPLQTLYLYQKP